VTLVRAHVNYTVDQSLPQHFAKNPGRQAARTAVKTKTIIHNVTCLNPIVMTEPFVVAKGVPREDTRSNSVLAFCMVREGANAIEQGLFISTQIGEAGRIGPKFVQGHIYRADFSSTRTTADTQAA
jgi:hypothetical protein